MIRFFTPLFCTVFFTVNVIAQVEPEPIPETANPNSITVNSNRLYGKIIDASTDKALQAASVQLYSSQANGADSLLAGMFSRQNGDFIFSNLPAEDSFRLDISAVGYKPWTKTIAFK